MTRQLRRVVWTALFVSAVIALVPMPGWAQSPIEDFDPGLDNYTFAVALQPDGKILVGGVFTMIGGGGTGTTPRARIARLNPDGSVDAGFNPGADAFVAALAVQPDGKILVGGSFNTLAGASQGRLGRLNADGSIDKAFTPVVTALVREIVVQPDGKIVVAGDFEELGGDPLRRRIGRLNADGSVDTTFNARTDVEIYALALQADGKILLGGGFERVNGIARNHIARLNADGSLDTAFNPGADINVNTIAVQPDGKILVGGDFGQLAGAARSYIGRLNKDGSLDTGFNPGADSGVEVVVLQQDGRIIVGGWFTHLVDINPRNRIGRLLPDGSLDPYFDPDAGAAVRGLAVQPDGKIVAIGDFTTIGRQPGPVPPPVSRSRIARLHVDGTVEFPFNPGIDVTGGTVFALAMQPQGWIAVGGVFGGMGGSSLPQRVAELSQNGVMFSYGNADDAVLTFATQADDKILGGGTFLQFGSLPGCCDRIGRLDRFAVYADAAFQPDAGGTVTAIAVQPDSKIVAAGGFLTLAGATRWRVGRMDINGVIDAGFADPAINNAVNSIALQPDGRIVIGGNFTAVGVPARQKIARLEANGTLDTTFNPGANGNVSVVALQPDGKILVGGVFSMIGGGGTGSTPRQNIARLNADGLVDSTFNPGADGEVNAFAIQTDGKIIVGGAFANLGGSSRSRIARLNPDGTLDPDFNPGVNGQANSLAIQADGRIVVAGPFIGLGGGTGTTPRLNIGRLTNTTIATQSLSTSAGGAIITWLRGGSSPEVSRVTFEVSTDGNTYTPLGAGTRINGGWRLSGLSLPVRQNIFIRARGHYQSGYRNGSGSIAETVRNVYVGWSPFTDDELTAGLHVIKGVHITELRTRIDAVRAREGLAAFTYTNGSIVATASVVSAVDVSELRTALAEVYTAMGLAAPSYGTTPGAGVTVRAVDITTLRSATGAVE